MDVDANGLARFGPTMRIIRDRWTIMVEGHPLVSVAYSLAMAVAAFTCVLTDGVLKGIAGAVLLLLSAGLLTVYVLGLTKR
jgi:hypothetical protein